MKSTKWFGYQRSKFPEETEIVEVWDKFYKDGSSFKFIRWLNKIYFTKIFEREFDKITKNKKGKFLEVGCGEAIMSSRLQKKGNDITLMDISQSALNQARLNFKKEPEMILGDIFNNKLKSGSFDVVWNQGVLEHYDNAETMIKEMYKLVKKGGYLIIFVPAKFSLVNFYYIFLSFLKLKKLFGKQIFYSKKLLEEQTYSATNKYARAKRVILSLGFSMVIWVTK